MSPLGVLAFEDDSIEEVSKAVEPDSSALFLATRHPDTERIAEEREGSNFEVVETKLSPVGSIRFRDTFAAQEVAG